MEDDQKRFSQKIEKIQYIVANFQILMRKLRGKHREELESLAQKVKEKKLAEIQKKLHSD